MMPEPTPDTPVSLTRLVGMDQLALFVQMVRSLTESLWSDDPGRIMQFYVTLANQCPDLFNAMQANFWGEWSKIRFTREVTSLTCMQGDTAPDLQSEHHPPRPTKGLPHELP
jgi:hypothetical protein